MPDPTIAQKEAIRTLDRNLLVSAGAGSGKTSVLVSRFLRMVAGDADPEAPAGPTAAVDGVLTITFTDKAAGEMRERIAQALAGRGLVEQRRQLEIAYISTIHGFCRRLLQENPFEAALDPQFATIEGGRGLLLREECFEQVVERAFESGDPDLVALILECQEARSRQPGEDALSELRGAVLAATDAMRSLGWEAGDLQRWLDEGTAGILQRVAGLVAEPLARVWEEAKELGHTLRDLRLTGDAEEGRRRLNEWARNATSIGPDETLEALAARAEELRALRPATTLAPRARREYDPRAYAELKDAQKRIRALIDDAMLQSFTLEREDAAAGQALRFLRMALAVWRAYDAAKEQLSALDFNDLQSKARRLLAASQGVRRRYQRKFRYVMVDEFQDTDRLQKSIIDLLRGDRNFFVVGDVKQSIYGWRNADVRLFMGLDREFSARERLEPERYRRLPLAENFRSRPEILHYVNAVFRDVWMQDEPEESGRVGEWESGRQEGTGAPVRPLPHSPAPPLSGTPATPFEALEARGTFTEKAEPSVELLLVPRGDLRADQRREQEAELIAGRLAEIHGTLPLTSARRKSDRVRWADCLILLRQLTAVGVYEDALVRHGIPYFIVGGRGYYARREIRDLVCLLRVIGSPLDDVATAAVLRSPFVGISLDALAVLSRQARHLEAYPCLYRAIPQVLKDTDLPEADRAALQRFRELVEGLRRNADRLKPGWLLDQALSETHYDARVLARPDGRRRLANVRKLVQMANTFAAPDVAALVRHLESLTQVSADEGDAPSYSEAADVVRIMSIHRAKGLEAPVVILPDLGREMSSRAPGLVLAEPEEHLIGMRVPEGGEWKPSVALSLLHARKARKEHEEEERLLYVAMTRAEEHLVLSGPMPPGSNTWGEWLYGLRMPFPVPPVEAQIAPLAGIEDLLVRVQGSAVVPQG